MKRTLGGRGWDRPGCGADYLNKRLGVTAETHLCFTDGTHSAVLN
jgi:hypothetical protein